MRFIDYALLPFLYPFSFIARLKVVDWLYMLFDACRLTYRGDNALGSLIRLATLPSGMIP